MWEHPQYYKRLDGQIERITWHASGDKIIRTNSQPLSPILSSEAETLVLLSYISYHQEPLNAWLSNTISHGVATVARVKTVRYQVDNQEKLYYLANLQTAQSGYDGVYQQSTIYSTQEHLVGSLLAGHVITQRYELEYGYGASHRLFCYQATKQKR